MKPLFLWPLRLLLGGLFVWAGLLKLADPNQFALEIANYRLLPQAAPLLAAAIPSTELLLGLGLLALPERWRRASALGLLFLLLLFTAAVTQAVLRGIDVSCGCFGGRSDTVSWLTVGRDLLLLAAAGLAALPDRRAGKAAPGLLPPPGC
jgi:uncharacterized membrane protein YphA (DoxX/SURF4 family)